MKKESKREVLSVPLSGSRTFLMMQRVIVLLLCFNLNLISEVMAQKIVEFKVDNADLKFCIKKVEQLSGLGFLYNGKELEQIDGITLHMKNVEVETLLKELLKGSGYTYELTNGVIAIMKVENGLPESERRPIVLLKGFVRDVKKQSLPGVTIRLLGTTVGTVTDAKGWFRLSLPVDSGRLEFSFVGYKKQMLTFTAKMAKDTLYVTLKEDVRAMEEVVVTGYQVLKKHSMVGSTSSVRAEDLNIGGTLSLEQALQGELPGVMILNQSGLTGTRQKVRVRGTSTLIGNADPVWVVDGIIQEDPLPFNAMELTNIGNDDMINEFVGSAISWLNPNDIESVTVLKDASATAIYGVKAANGVIVITTKKGERGRLSINYAGSISTGSKITYDRMNLMNSKQRVDFSREIYENGGLFSTQHVGYLYWALEYKLGNISLEKFSEEVKKLETVNTDWFDILFCNPFSHTHNLSISGGNEKTTYRASFGFSDVNNTAKGNGQRKYNGSLNISSSFWSRVIAGFTLSGSYIKTKGFLGVDPYEYASKVSRTIACYDENGELFFYPYSSGNGMFKYNYLYEKQHSGNENVNSGLNASLNLRVTLFDGLVLSSVFGLNYTSVHGESYYSERSNYITNIRGYEYHELDPVTGIMRQDGNLPHGGMLTQTENRNLNYTWRNSLEYAQVFGKHGITVMLGQECRSTKIDGSSQTQYGYLPEWGKSFAVVPATENNEGEVVNKYAVTTPKIVDQTSNFLSFYATASYMYDNRYAFNASIRSDASNRFGQDKKTRYQPVWSVGFRWNMSREHWLEGQDILNDVSFRLSYGYQGNAAENVGPDLITSIPSSGGIDEKTGKYVLNVKTLPAPDLTWEKTKTINAGVDFSILNSKINLSFNYYYKRTEDMIVFKDVPYENGVTSMAINGGNMTNSGWDMSVSFIPVRTQDFVWSLSANFSQNYNKLKSALEDKWDWKTAVSGSLNKKGYPVSGFWVFRFNGLNPENGAPDIDLSGTEKEAAVRDATEYMEYAGKLDPDFSSGINTSFRYRSLVLGASFYLSLGAKKLLAPLYSEDNFKLAVSEYNNLSKDMVKRWKKKGDEAYTNIPAIPDIYRNAGVKPFSKDRFDYILYPYEMYNNSSARVVNASYLRCNNISLSYTMPYELIKRFAQSMSFSFVVNNPFQIVSKDYKGVDPEVAMGNQPLTKTYTFSLNVSF